MPHHEWGDEWFERYGEDLNKAMHHINQCYHSKTNKFIMMKEKYGAIRYEFIGSIGVTEPADFHVLKAVLEDAIEKFPHIKDEILADSPFYDDGEL